MAFGTVIRALWTDWILVQPGEEQMGAMGTNLLFRIKRNDRTKTLLVQAADGKGAYLDLTGATIVFSMRALDSVTLKVNRQAATIVDAATGQMEYQWAAADVNASGFYAGEFEVTQGGKTLTLPEDGYIRIEITDDLA